MLYQNEDNVAKHIFDRETNIVGIEGLDLVVISHELALVKKLTKFYLQLKLSSLFGICIKLHVHFLGAAGSKANLDGPG